jgi:hypothetical protein
MTSDLPAWTPFDPDAPPVLSPDGNRPGRIVALVAGAGAMKGGWVGEVTLGLAASWGVATGGRVVAADAAFQEPCLHSAANVPLDEGLSDMLLWGGSLQRVARATERVGFVVTAGTPIVDGASALHSARWGEVCEGFREAGVTLVVLVPVSEAGLPDVVREASDVVLLLAPDEPPAGVLAEGREKVRAAVGLAATVGAPAEPRVDPAKALDVLDEDAAPEVLAADDPRYRVPEGRPAEKARKFVAASSVSRPSRGRGRIVAIVAVAIVLVIAVLAAAYLGYLNIPGVTRGGPGGQASGALLLPAEDAPRQAFSVDVGTFDDAVAASARATALSEALPDVIVITEPVSAAGILQHRVLAGPATDAAAADALVGRLRAALGTDVGQAQPIATPRAFQLGEMPELDAALRRMAVLAGLEIPAYVLAVDYQDGSVRYRVYAGAYAEESEGVGLARLLQERGLSASALTERIGRVPAPDS